MPYLVKDGTKTIAVATLEAAREVVAAKLPTGASVYDLGLPSEGTVGPLPDGTVIEVEAIWWADLREQAGLDRDGLTLDADTLAAYNNAKHGA